ncbi:hypothetical protein BDZ91DRAFT_410594 [Kalaharituber pfeilii]|nr:hypothetical protein BDZ91DRAFT_410594 [Kalaharituber pfeilii]
MPPHADPIGTTVTPPTTATITFPNSSTSLQPLIDSHIAARTALISHERSLRHDHSFRRRLSPTARRACAIAQCIRDHEARTVWAKEAALDAAAGQEVFPGMVFTLAKDRMERTELWRIVKRLPKGALLHAHIGAMVDVDWLLQLAMKTPGIHILSKSGPIRTEEDLATADICFTYIPPSDSPDSPITLYEATYEAGHPIPLHTAAATFPFKFTALHGSIPLPTAVSDHASKPTLAFLSWLQSRTTITPHEALLHHDGIDCIWAKFRSIFFVLSGLIYYEPILRAFIAHLFDALHRDGISWVDMRAAFHMCPQASHTGCPQAAHTGLPLTFTDVVRIYGEEVHKYRQSHPDFWGSRIIWTATRILSSTEIKENMEACLLAAETYPDLIAGFDLVGQEDPGRTLLEHLPELLWFRNECESRGLSIPFYFHAGETLGDGTGADDNLYDAILLGTRRIGHGFSLYKHPHLMDLVKHNGTVVEVCPISNEILRLTASIMGHPLPALLANGIKVVIANDDPGILGQKTTGSLTHDMWQVCQAFGNVGLEGLGAMCETAAEAAAYVGGDEEKERRVAEWRDRWEEFCVWVVREYGAWDGVGVQVAN